LRFVAAAAAAWVVACSAGVDGFRIDDKGGHAGDGSGGGSSETGGATASGGDGGATADSGGASSGGRGKGGDGGLGNGGAGKPPSSGGSNELNTGGATLMTSGGQGGTGNGGVASGGGKATGGTGNGGAGGKGSGGIGSGGIGAGGAGTGGANGGAGGMNTTTPGDPVQVPLSDPSLTGITAAAWDGSFFFLLQASAHQFYQVNPAPPTAQVTGPFPLPTGVAAYAFGVSSSGVFVVAGTKAFKVPRTGYTSQAGVTIPAFTQPSGAYAGSYFLIGDLANSGSSTARALDASGALASTASSLGAVYAVGSDGSNFGYSTFDGNVMRVHQIPGSSLSPNAFDCAGDSAGGQDHQISVYGNTVAWVKGESTFMLLYIAQNSSGTCPVPPPQPIQYGTSGAGPYAVGLINDGDALVVEKFASGTGELQIHGRSGQHKPLTNVYFSGSTQPKQIVVGSGHYAAVVSGYTPAIISF
jgi:hypothetical protein